MSWAGPNGNNNPFPRPGGPQQFWSWVNSDPNARAGAGVDHAGPWGGPGFPFHGAEFSFGGPGGWGAYGGWGDRRGGPGHRRGGGRCGSRGRHGRHGPRHGDEGDETHEDIMRDIDDAEISDKEKDDSPETMRDSPDEGGPEHEHGHQHGPGRRGGRGRFGGRGGGGDHWRHSRHHHGPHGPRGAHPPPPPPAPFGAGPPPPPPYGHPPPPPPPGFDFTGFLNQFAGHPFAQQIRDWASRFGGLNTPGGPRGGPDFGGPAGPNDDSSFTPPVDIFATERSYVLHFALPGAKKEDIGVDWDADKGELRVAGVVYRPGDEDFLATMASSERRIGMFARSVPLPPAGAEREEIDALSITAKMEDGVLIVTVPKLEKEWTEIHKVDIE
ncbi:Heat shock protein 16 [Colletotrichum aenigma]|uniref:Heat shock protein 16 n=1 Tax=Colletotrichum aenigma TaxID=1215731 RepID=UPI001872732C|nr:Heat shock protein 16 [Colletotrichum aenigma]KAF5527006.1 Heat shock protein 16 [Colletotrichum aenigma]